MIVRLFVVAAVLCAVHLATANPAAAASTIPRGAGAALCGALTPADFAGAGVSGASNPKANVSDKNDAYCVYAGKSSATGGIELDVSYSAGSDPKTVEETVQNAVGETGGYSEGKFQKVKLAGADEAWLSTHTVSGGPPFAEMIVRKGDLVLTLGIPTSDKAQAQLMKLSTTALSRF